MSRTFSVRLRSTMLQKLVNRDVFLSYCGKGLQLMQEISTGNLH